MLRIGLLTVDPVNYHYGRKWAKRCGTTLRAMQPREGAPERTFDAIIFDFDYWPCTRRHDLLEYLLQQALPAGVVVCSYNLDPQTRKALRRRGARVFRRVGMKVFRALRRTVAS